MDSSLNFQQHLLKQDYLNSLSKSLAASQNPSMVPPTVAPVPSALPSVITPVVAATPSAVTAVTPAVVPTATTVVPPVTAPPSRSILKSFLGMKQPDVVVPTTTPTIVSTTVPTPSTPIPTPTPSLPVKTPSVVPSLLVPVAAPSAVAAVTPVVPEIVPEGTVAAVPQKSFYTSYEFMAGVTLFLLATGIGITVLIMFLKKKKKSSKKEKLQMYLRNAANFQPTRETIVSSVLPRQETATRQSVTEQFVKGPEKKDEYDDPQSRREIEINSIFPSTQNINEDSEEATFAKQYTYENLHDSMFARPKTKPTQKSPNPAWESNVQDIKEEMLKSGQSLDDYLKSSNAPVSDDFVDAWKSTSVKTKPRDAFNLPVPKYAQKEMPALVADSTQTIPMDGKNVAHTAMEEILSARKRAKVLGVSLPSATQTQKDAVEKWSKSDEKAVSSLANSLKTMI